jgi:glycosyltransferase involved in cell wall biosynthesis
VTRTLAPILKLVTGVGVWAVAALTFGVALAACRLRRWRPGRRWQPTGRILVVGTFYNPNWFLSHARPLAQSGLEEIIVVTDEPQGDLERVRFACPPRLAARVLGRTVAKLVWAVVVGVQSRPDLCMGYHIIPNSVVALIAARLLGRPAAYQMTGGPIEVLDGGIGSENSWMTKLAWPSPFLERLALAVVKEFDLVVVRGTTARRFLGEHDIEDSVTIIPGSVDASYLSTATDRPCDLLYVGRFTETKRPLEFVEIVAAVAGAFPALRAVMVGDGPLMDEVRARARTLGIADRLELRGKSSEVADLLGRTRIFVLTSRSEGLSIAMAEAMMAGAVPVVTRVGDLGDLVRDGDNGFLLEPGDRAGFAASIRKILADPPLQARLSAAAVTTARAHVGLERVSALWAQHIPAVVARCSGGSAASSPLAGRSVQT